MPRFDDAFFLRCCVLLGVDGTQLTGCHWRLLEVLDVLLSPRQLVFQPGYGAPAHIFPRRGLTEVRLFSRDELLWNFEVELWGGKVRKEVLHKYRTGRSELCVPAAC